MTNVGVSRLSRSQVSKVTSTPASFAMAIMCSTMLVEPPTVKAHTHGVLECVLRQDPGGTDVVLHQLHDPHAGVLGGTELVVAARRKSTAVRQCASPRASV